MKNLFVKIAAAGLLMLAPAIAEAAEGYSTANVNMRAGPSTRYPAVAVIPAGSSIEIRGCLSDVNWCDVEFYGGRGWVSGQYVQALYQQRRVYVGPQYYRPLGIPMIRFSVDIGTATTATAISIANVTAGAAARTITTATATIEIATAIGITGIATGAGVSGIATEMGATEIVTGATTINGAIGKGAICKGAISKEVTGKGTTAGAMTAGQTVGILIADPAIPPATNEKGDGSAVLFRGLPRANTQEKARRSLGGMHRA